MCDSSVLAVECMAVTCTANACVVVACATGAVRGSSVCLWKEHVWQ